MLYKGAGPTAQQLAVAAVCRGRGVGGAIYLMNGLQKKVQASLWAGPPARCR